MSAPRMTRFALVGLMVSMALGSVHAKPADDYFHGGASKYVAGKHQEALIEVEEGLRQHSDDARLQKLAEQIRKMQNQQNPQGDKNKKKDPDKKHPDKKDPEKDKKQDEKKPDPKDDPKKNGKQPNGAPPPGQMSEDEAKRLLNSFADDEKKEQRERQKLLRKRLQSDQDW
jgi:single-stranded DNA-binding protein